MRGSGAQHVLERRSSLLTQKIAERQSDLTLVLRAAGGRVPFHEKLSYKRAMEWWSEHRYDDLGQTALRGYDPQDVVSLDTALAQYNQNKQDAGLPIEGPDTSDQDAAAAGFAANGGLDAST